VFFYQDEDGRAPVVEWLKTPRREDRKAYAKCVARIRRLAEAGHELRRPEADYLRDGLYELRARHGRVNYRILYFFHGQQVALLAHGLTKEGERYLQETSSAPRGEKTPLSMTPNGIPTRKRQTMAKTKDALDIIDALTGNDPELRALIAEETINAHVARMVYEARTKAGLTQQELAELVGTKQPVIARLEDADYKGHSLAMLQRIATALHQKLEISLVPTTDKTHHA
jgi:ribosome-binding protein aMBF1 (putative translation factor)